MPQLLSWLGTLLISIAGNFVLNALTKLGIGVVAYKGLDVTIGWLKSSAVTALVGLPPDVIGLLGVMRVGSCISLIFSAITVRLVSQGMTSGTVKKWVTK